MDALVVSGPGALSVSSRALPEPGPDEAVVEVAYGRICGSDLHYWKGGRVLAGRRHSGGRPSGTGVRALCVLPARRAEPLHRHALPGQRGAPAAHRRRLAERLVVSARELTLTGSSRFFHELPDVLDIMRRERERFAPIVTAVFQVDGVDSAEAAFQEAADASRSSKVLLSFGPGEPR